MTAVHRRDLLDVIAGLQADVRALRGTVLGGPMTGYTVAWSATGGTSTGTGGQIVGRYSRTGRTVTAVIYLQLGTTPALGTGSWSFSVPAPALTTTVNFVGSWYATVAGLNYTGVAVITSTAILCLMGAGTSAALDATHPAAWTANSQLSIEVTYEATA